MSLKKLSRQLKIPLQALKKMVSDGLISDPPTEQELNNLSFLAHFWGKKDWLQIQLTRFKRRQRMAILTTADMEKIDAYIFNRYFYATERLLVEKVADEVSHYYKVPNNKRLKKRIYRVREKARKAKQHLKKVMEAPSKRCVNCALAVRYRSVR